MSLVFPINPYVNQTTTTGGRTWTYNGSGWVPALSPGGNLQAITSNLIPSSDLVYDLGSIDNRWRDLYLSGNTIDLGGTAIKAVGGSVTFTDSENPQISRSISVAEIAIGTGANLVTLTSSATGIVANVGGVVSEAIGATGATGPAGTTGIDGATGATGVGTAGATGLTGATGAPGPAGTGGSGSGANVTVSNTAPISANIGNMWLDDETGKLRIYYGGGWAGVAVGPVGATGPQGPAGASGPAGPSGTAAAAYLRVSNVSITDSSYNVLDDTAIDLSGGYIKLTGDGFQTGCHVVVGSNVATSTTFVSNTEVNSQVGAASAGTYILYLVNPDGSTATRVNALTYSASPTWVTGSTLNSVLKNETVNQQLSATGASTYSVSVGSSLPGNVAFFSNGQLFGTAPNISSDTNYTFTLVATDNELQDSPRTFTLPVLVGFPVQYLILGGGGGAPFGTISGGGGGGGMVEGNIVLGTGSPYPVGVGEGGGAGRGTAPWTTTINATGGGNSTLVGMTAYGGGAGNGGNGGSGGGSTGAWQGSGPFVPGGYAVYPGSPFVSADRQGYNGGSAPGSGTYGGAGGGGAGGVGGNAGGGAGGVGKSSSITGSAVFYGGGGGGGGYNGPGGAGGNGGGGTAGGGTDASAPGNAGTEGLGGGAGGNSNGGSGAQGRKGGRGVVIIRYPSTYFPILSGNVTAETINLFNGNAYTRFTCGSGTFTLSTIIEPAVEYLVVAGGGGGGAGVAATGAGGGGGAGGVVYGYLNNISLNTNYTITVGGGGTASSSGSTAAAGSGSNSVFASITAVGGGGGANTSSSGPVAGAGGSGGGGKSPGGLSTGTQGNRGGFSSLGSGGSGGGGYGSSGVDNPNFAGTYSTGVAGGSSGNFTITGSSVAYAGGGGGGGYGPSTGYSTGGAGGGAGAGAGGGNGGSAASANTGSGGGGGGGGDSVGSAGGAGGSGVVIIKITNTRTATFSGGITSSLSTALSGFKVYTVTAGTGTVTFT